MVSLHDIDVMFRPSESCSSIPRTLSFYKNTATYCVVYERASFSMKSLRLFDKRSYASASFTRAFSQFAKPCCLGDNARWRFSIRSRSLDSSNGVTTLPSESGVNLKIPKSMPTVSSRETFSTAGSLRCSGSWSTTTEAYHLPNFFLETVFFDDPVFGEWSVVVYVHRADFREFECDVFGSARVTIHVKARLIEHDTAVLSWGFPLEFPNVVPLGFDCLEYAEAGEDASCHLQALGVDCLPRVPPVFPRREFVFGVGCTWVCLQLEQSRKVQARDYTLPDRCWCVCEPRSPHLRLGTRGTWTSVPLSICWVRATWRFSLTQVFVSYIHEYSDPWNSARYRLKSS